MQRQIRISVKRHLSVINSANVRFDLFTKATPIFRYWCILFSLLLSCWYVAGQSTLHSLPDSVTMNRDAGRGNFLFLMLRLEGGEPLPFIFDSGAPYTCVDKSFASRLGTCFGVYPFEMLGSKQKAGVYAVPKLDLGIVPLIIDTDSCVVSFDFTWLSKEAGRPVMGILGMDCIKNYCVQLDFRSSELRFLDSHHSTMPNSGIIIPLTLDDNRPRIRKPGFIGNGISELVIDTGCCVDGLVQKKLFQQAVKQHQLAKRDDDAIIPRCIWEGEVYTNLTVGVVPNRVENAIGLRFLARYLVTLDFPNQKLYLTKKKAGPP